MYYSKNFSLFYDDVRLDQKYIGTIFKRTIAQYYRNQ